ncbi:MAG: AAA family ATPase [Candidatus Geothermarchaeales archaeon]
MASRKRGFFLVLEGLPGSGKTTVGELLKELEWVFFPEVATLLGERGIPIGDRGDTSSDFLIFAEEFRRVKEIERHIGEGRNVVVDSYFPTDLAFAYARYKQNQSQCYSICLNLYLSAQTAGTILKPDLYVYFDIPLRASVERQTKRRNDEFTTLNVNLLRNVKKHLSYVHHTFESEIPVLKVDARKTSKEIIKDILNVVMRRQEKS